MSNLTTANGIPIQTVIAQPGANPRQSAFLITQANSAQQAAATKALAGGRKKRRTLRGGQAAPAGAPIPVPLRSPPYNPGVGPEQTPNAQTVKIAQMATQQQANQAYDSKAGGSRRKRGGNPDWIWPCMSGGVSRSKRTRKLRRTRQMRRTRQLRRTRQMRKSRKYRRH